MKKAPQQDSRALYKRLGKVVVSSVQIRRKTRELAAKINKAYKDSPTGVVLISNLKGSFRFLSDLCSMLRVPVRLDFVAFNSYGGGTATSGEVRIVKDLKMDVTGQHILIVEDIVDTGYTLKFLSRYLKGLKQAASVKVCSLLDKKSARKVPVRIDFRGLTVPGLFLVGYGLDYKEYFRELNEIREFVSD